MSNLFTLIDTIRTEREVLETARADLVTHTKTTMEEINLKLESLIGNINWLIEEHDRRLADLIGDSLKETTKTEE